MSSENRRIALKAFESEVPPLNTSEAVGPFGKLKMRRRVQQTQKSFSMMVFATPRPAPVSPKRAARSAAERRATLSKEVARPEIGNRQQGGTHPGGRLGGAFGEGPLVAVGEASGSDL